MLAEGRRALLLVLLASAALPAAAQAPGPGPAGVSVRGDVLRPLQLGREELAAFAADEQASTSVLRRVAGQERQTTARGVRLRALLARAGLAERDRLDWRKTVVIVSASDGYRVVFSWPELENTEAGAQVLVLYERDGAPLPASEGPLALLAAADLRPGPRHVKWLSTVEVRILRE
ncbi:molybdopterin-dependent oxidoreductase [Rivibacter subsaxonicus]|uniref:Molybdopterin-dependent oxidoreductase-like protein n=1 Tax=Rivibacter subsaxonicus TaxID=457575 RepID=A0A4Q7VNW0_9BURK|nr:molybdopterin-dependent oxidoreductase [Rivibacter subsaxonicus]RZT97914.1 molybdopterin-dependent oxidoreductase-like protein [Rivibacter subsaxonicus]